MSVPPFDLLAPRIFNKNYVCDNQLPGGRMLIPFGFSFANLSAPFNPSFPQTLISPLAAQGTIDFKQVRSVVAFGAAKNIQFSVDFGGNITQAATLGNVGALFIGPPDSGQIIEIGPSGSSAYTNTSNEYGSVTGCVDLDTNDCVLTFTKVADILGGGATQVNGIIYGTIANYERKNYLYGGVATRG